MNLTNYDRWPIHLVSDSYARLCVSEPASVLEIKQTFDGRTLFFDSLTAGTVRDEAVLVVKNLSASANTFYGSIGWVEKN